MHAGNAQLEPEVVKVGVAGLHHRLVHIHVAVAPALPVPVTVRVVLQLIVAGIEDGALPVGDAGVQARQSDERFHGGAGRVAALQGAVEQGVVQVFPVAGVVLVGNAVDEQVGVEHRPADERQHAAVTGVDGHHRAAPVAEGVVGGSLHLHIQGQAQILAGHRRLLLQHAQYPAPGVGFHLAVAHLAVQAVLVVTLHPAAPVVVGAGVIALFGEGHAVQVFRVEPVHVAQNMGKQLAVGVVAHRVGGHAHARQPMLVHRDAGDLVFAQAPAQGNRVPGPARPLQTLVEAFDVVAFQRHQPVNFTQGPLQVGNLLDDHFHGEIRPVGGENFAVAVGDQPARRRHRLGLHPVFITERGIAAVLENLQPGHAPHQPHGQQGDQNGAHQQAKAENPLLVVVVF